MRPLTAFEKRLLAVLLLLVAVVLLIGAIAIPYSRLLHHYDDEISNRLDFIARYRRIVATLPDLKRSMAAVRAKDAGQYYLKSNAPSLVAADIQQTVQTLATKNSLQLDSMQIAQPKMEDGYRKITLNLRLRGTLAGLQTTLYALETGTPYLFIDNLSIQATVPRNYQPKPGFEPNVTAQFDLYGYSRVEKKHAATRD